MPLYGSIDGAKRLLRAVDTSTFSADADARLVALQRAVSLLIEHETGRTFGTAQPPEARTFDLPYSDMLIMDPSAKDVTLVVAGGVAVDSTFWELKHIDKEGWAYGLRRRDGWSWRGATVTEATVTARWADQDADAAAPDDVTYVANYLIAERFKVEQASPAGFTGPEGQVIPIRNVMKDPIVAGVLCKYRTNNPAQAGLVAV